MRARFIVPSTLAKRITFVCVNLVRYPLLAGLINKRFNHLTSQDKDAIMAAMSRGPIDSDTAQRLCAILENGPIADP